MNCAELYEVAYRYQYYDDRSDEALKLYKDLINQFPQSKEAGYARTQIKNIGPVIASSNNVEGTNAQKQNTSNVDSNADEVSSNGSGNGRLYVNNSVQPNSTATALKGIGIVTIAMGIISGMILGSEFGGYHFAWSYALFAWISSFISGMMFVGFGEVISQLNIIAQK